MHMYVGRFINNVVFFFFFFFFLSFFQFEMNNWTEHREERKSGENSLRLWSKRFLWQNISNWNFLNRFDRLEDDIYLGIVNFGFFLPSSENV